MKDKTLKQTQKLVPGQDELVRGDGSTTPIVSIVVGDYSLKISLASSDNAIPDEYADDLAFDTKAYNDQYGHLV